MSLPHYRQNPSGFHDDYWTNTRTGWLIRTTFADGHVTARWAENERGAREHMRDLDNLWRHVPIVIELIPGALKTKRVTTYRFEAKHPAVSAEPDEVPSLPGLGGTE